MVLAAPGAGRGNADRCNQQAGMEGFAAFGYTELRCDLT